MLLQVVGGPVCNTVAESMSVMADLHRIEFPNDLPDVQWEVVGSTRYGLPTKQWPPALREEVDGFEAWTTNVVQLDRPSAYKGMQAISWDKYEDIICSFMGFLHRCMNLAINTLSLRYFLDPSMVVHMVSFLVQRQSASTITKTIEVARKINAYWGLQSTGTWPPYMVRKMDPWLKVLNNQARLKVPRDPESILHEPPQFGPLQKMIEHMVGESIKIAKAALPV